MKKIVALIGKAGSGKDTIMRKIIEWYPDQFHEIVSCTTRPPREGEQDGINYHFLTVEQFTEKVLNGDMLEATEFNGWHYGTARSALLEDKINIGVFNPTGVYCLMENTDIDLQVFYIIADDKERLIRQLNRQVSPDVDEIIRRYTTDKRDFAYLSDINYISITNNAQKDYLRAAERIKAEIK